jgi:hypothetical protein
MSGRQAESDDRGETQRFTILRQWLIASEDRIAGVPRREAGPVTG